MFNIFRSNNHIEKLKPTNSLGRITSSVISALTSVYEVSTANMAITEATLRDKLSKNLNIEHLDVIDESNCSCGLKFNVTIVSDDFKGKALIQRHRMVNSILEEELKLIHAFSQRTLTVEQWQKSKN